MTFTILGGGWYFFFDEEINTNEPVYIMQTITEKSMNARTITWQTKKSEQPQTIIYYAENTTEKKSIKVEPNELTTGAEEMSAYTVTLNDLIPNKLYFYKVGSEGQWSQWHSLKTEDSPNNQVKAIIFGDSQSEKYEVWAKTAQAAWQNNDNANFFVNMGDLVDIGSDYDQWKSWIDGAGAMITDIPVASLSGNHENYLPGGTFTPAYLYKQIFHLPQNGPTNLKGQVYSFDYGNSHFVMLDSQLQELENFQPELIKDQIKWLEEDLKNTKKEWKIVLIHRPLFINDKSGKLNMLGKSFIPIFDKYHVDVVFSAHIHTYGRSLPLYKGTIAKQREQGTVYISTGRSGDKTWAEAKQKHFEPMFDNSLDQPNYLVLEGEKGKLKVTGYRQDGTLIDKIELNK